MKKKKKTTKYRRTVTCSPDSRSRSITVSSNEKLSKKEFLEELIIYLAEQESVLYSDLNPIPGGDPSNLH